MKNPNQIVLEELTETAQLALEKYRKSHEEKLDMLHYALKCAIQERNIEMLYDIFYAIADIRRRLDNCVPDLKHWEMMPRQNPASLPDTIKPHHFGDVKEKLPNDKELTKDKEALEIRAE